MAICVRVNESQFEILNFVCLVLRNVKCQMSCRLCVCVSLCVCLSVLLKKCEKLKLGGFKLRHSSLNSRLAHMRATPIEERWEVIKRKSLGE